MWPQPEQPGTSVIPRTLVPNTFRVGMPIPLKKKTLQCREMHSPRISPKGWWTVLQPQTCLKFLPWGSIGVGKAEAKREESVPGLWPSSFYREGSTKEAELARQLPEYRQPVPLPVQG
jgi:hypothetical protein